MKAVISKCSTLAALKPWKNNFLQLKDILVGSVSENYFCSDLIEEQYKYLGSELRAHVRFDK